MKQETTAHLGLPLPHPNNCLEDDVLHLREAMHGIDRAMYQQSQATEALGESVQDITTEITAQLQAQTLALGTQVQAGTQTVTDAVAAQALAIQGLAGDIATSAQQLDDAMASRGQTLEAAIGKSPENFHILKIFTESSSHTFTHPGTIFLRGLGAGAGGTAGKVNTDKVGGAGGWGQVVKKVAAGDVLQVVIGAGGLGASYQNGAGSIPAPGGSTILTLHGIAYTAAGGSVTDDGIACTGPWDFAMSARKIGDGDVAGIYSSEGAFNHHVAEQLQGWGVRLESGNAIQNSIGKIFMRGSSVDYRGDGSVGGRGGGGGYGRREDEVLVRGGAGGAGLAVMYFWPQTNP